MAKRILNGGNAIQIEPKVISASGEGSGQTYSQATHYFALDGVRVMAAVAVLFWHYQHFFMPSALSQVTPAQRMLSPLYSFFGPIYDYGYIAVQIFWILSGFVFAAVYVERQVTNVSFFWARFARLYPLHMFTLIVVATLQSLSVAVVGHEQIYSYNDWYHFILQVFMASQWGFQHGSSFNGPIWSVSVEILLYLAFWLVLPLIRKAQLNVAFILALICWIFANFSEAAGYLVWTGGSYFFAGVAVWRFQNKTQSRPSIIACFAALSFASGLIILARLPQFENSLAVPMIAIGLLGLALALDRSALQRYLKHTKPMGDLTYGIYLWHVPVQIAALIALQYRGASNLAYSPYFLIGFLFTVIALAAVSFRYFELPLRVKFRR